jgi:hypothetical protein
MANTIVYGYPQPIGGKIQMKVDHYGPASYVQYVAATGVGDVINASDVGVGGFESAGATWSSYSNSGNYIVNIKLNTATQTQPGSAVAKFTVQWFTTSAAFGTISTEATATTNLSAEYVRLALDCV